jgi:ankyrin repeat protein
MQKRDYASLALMIIVESDDANKVKDLLEEGADPNVRNYKGQTALTRASKHEYLEIVGLLLKAGADPNLKDQFGNNALMNALYGIYVYMSIKISNRRKKIVTLLLKAGVDLTMKNNEQLTALDVAIKKGNNGIIQIIKKALLKRTILIPMLHKKFRINENIIRELSFYIYV